MNSKVQCLLYYENCTTEGRVGEKGGSANFKTKHIDPRKPRSLYIGIDESKMTRKTVNQATCKFECRIQMALLSMEEDERCLPWYYPQVDPKARMCSPFEAIAVRERIDTSSSNTCNVSVLG